MWRPPGQHLVHQRAETTEVDARANLLRGELLRRHVAQRAHDHSSLGRSLQRLAQQPRDAEVDEPGVAIGPDQDISGLDVAVDHATCMGVVKGLGDFCPDLGSRPRIERSLPFETRFARWTCLDDVATSRGTCRDCASPRGPEERKGGVWRRLDDYGNRSYARSITRAAAPGPFATRSVV